MHGYSLNEVENTGYAWMLLYWKVNVIRRPRWNEEISVKTWARKFEKVSSWRDFEVYDETENLILTATSNWVLIDAKLQRPARITEEIASKYVEVEKSVFEGELLGKLKSFENEEKIYEYTATRRDIDSNHHVNNVVYLELAYNAFPKSMSLNFDSFEIYYKKQIKLRRDYRSLF